MPPAGDSRGESPTLNPLSPLLNPLSSPSQPVLHFRVGRTPGPPRRRGTGSIHQRRTDKAEKGTLYHHKHYVAPTFEELTAMTRVGLTATRASTRPGRRARGGAAAPTCPPARALELRALHLQTLGHEDIQHQDTGDTFPPQADRLRVQDKDSTQPPPPASTRGAAARRAGARLLLRIKRDGPPPLA